MKRTNARNAVYGTLKSLGINPETLTRKTRIAHVLDTGVRLDFIKQLNEKMPGSLNLNPTQISILTVGQLVNVLGTELPGDDSTKGRRPRSVELSGDDATPGRRP